jgi:hypothetical protein
LLLDLKNLYNKNWNVLTKEGEMKFPNWFKILWWSLLLIALGVLLIERLSDISSGTGNSNDLVILAIWVILALAPIYTEVSFSGITVKQDLEKAAQDVKSAGNKLKEVSEILPSWDLLYEHDEQGNSINGTVDRLIEAVNNGYPIKVRIHFPKNTVHVIDAELLIIEDQMVYASNTSQISLTKNETGNPIYQAEPYHYYVIVGSDGHHHATRVFIDGTKRNENDTRRHMAWIGLVPPRI